jgi:hypothetical protein
MYICGCLIYIFGGPCCSSVSPSFLLLKNKLENIMYSLHGGTEKCENPSRLLV